MGTSGFLDLEGGKIYFEVDGEGHPLLLIHGGLGSLRMWDRQVPAFSEHYRVIRTTPVASGARRPTTWRSSTSMTPSPFSIK